MKFNLLTKYLFVYAAVALLGFLGVTFISYRIDYAKVYNYYTDALYKQALSISSEYADDYFSEEHLRIVETELRTVALLNDTRIMFIDTAGNIILDTAYAQEHNTKDILYTIDGFDYTSLGTKHAQTGDFYGMLDCTCLSVFAPITSSFTMKGYVVVHLDENVITSNVYTTFNTNYITLVMVMLLSLSFIALYFIQIHKPLNGIIKATKEYGKGNLAYKINIKNDIDEIGRLSASLNYMASKLDESDQFQQKFLSNISHDFRSPLTSIKGYVEAMLDGTIPVEMQDKYLNIILFETERLNKLTKSLLELNKFGSHGVMLDITSFDINHTIRMTVQTFEGTCMEKHISFNLILSGETLFVSADFSKIQQVLYNLIDNALKFSHASSAITIETTEKNEKVFVSVKDTGIGIPKDSIKKIWDRFYKTDLSRGKDKKGTGLGLSIVKEIIQAHGENINCISTEGVGTEFIFTLPLAKEQKEHA